MNIKRKKYIQLESQEKNREIIMHICGETYLSQEQQTGSYRENHCIDMVSNSFIQHKFIEQLLATRHCTGCELNKNNPSKVNITIWLNMIENRLKGKIYLISHLVCRGGT